MRFRPRIMPVLLLRDGGLVKSVKFDQHRYLGDPVNAVRIFNEKGVDELVLLDIDAARSRTFESASLLEEIASEAFMPLSIGGAIETLDDIEWRLGLGFEKVVLCTSAAERPEFIGEAARRFASSSIVVCIDVGSSRLGRPVVMTRGGQQRLKLDPVEHARAMERLGAGEIIIQSVDRDGSMNGYDLQLVERVASAVTIPVVALGGAAAMPDLSEAIESGAAAAAAGSMFVYQGRHRAVLISYPSDDDLSVLEPDGRASGRIQP